jgi:hypothetical protein
MTSNSDTLPRRGFNDLPPELKAQVVAAAAAQDEAFRVWLSKGVLAKELKKRDITIGRSISSLFRVNKELSNMCAPHLFKVRFVFPPLLSLH